MLFSTELRNVESTGETTGSTDTDPQIHIFTFILLFSAAVLKAAVHCSCCVILGALLEARVAPL